MALRSADEEGAPVAAAPVGVLVNRAQGGDRLAFARLVETHYALIFGTAFKWSGNRADAEDIAQEVCAKLGAAIHGFDGRAAFSTWLYRITLNAVRDLQRQRGRGQVHMAALAELGPNTQPPEQEAATTLGQLWRAVRRLPERQRDAVLLVYAEDLSHAAAAEILGCKEATISWHVFEAKRALKGLL